MDIKKYIEERMRSDEWYSVNSPAKIKEEMDKLDKNIEITFSKDFTKVKKIVWENDKPKIYKFIHKKTKP